MATLRNPNGVKRKKACGVIRKESFSTGQEVEEHWAKIRGEVPPIVGDVWAALERKLYGSKTTI